MDKPKISLIVPTLNEINGLKWFMPRLKKEWYDEMIIVDGGSVDGTIEYCKANGYDIFIQSGKGLPNGYDDAYQKVTGDIVVTITPDGNSLPELIPELVAKVKEGYDMVIASRYYKGAKSYDDDIFTGFGNKLFTCIINLVFGGKYTDTLVGLRAYRKDAIDAMRLCYQDRQGWIRKVNVLTNSWESCASIRAAKLKLRTCDISGDEPLRVGGIRKMSVIKNGLGVLFQIIHEVFLGSRFTRFDKVR